MGHISEQDLRTLASYTHRDRHDALRRMSATLEWACDAPRTIESWQPGIRMLASHTLASPPREVRKAFPPQIRLLLLLPLVGVLPQTRAYRLNLFHVEPEWRPPL